MLLSDIQQSDSVIHVSVPFLSFFKKIIHLFGCISSCSTWDLSLQFTDFLVMAHGLSSFGVPAEQLEHLGLISPQHVGS